MSRDVVQQVIATDGLNVFCRSKDCTTECRTLNKIMSPLAIYHNSQHHVLTITSARG